MLHDWMKVCLSPSLYSKKINSLKDAFNFWQKTICSLFQTTLLTPTYSPKEKAIFWHIWVLLACIMFHRVCSWRSILIQIKFLWLLTVILVSYLLLFCYPSYLRNLICHPDCLSRSDMCSLLLTSQDSSYVKKSLCFSWMIRKAGTWLLTFYLSGLINFVRDSL